MNNYAEVQPVTCLKTLAIGLILQSSEAVQSNSPLILPLNDHLRHGWEQLCYQCFQAGELPPRTLQELVHCLHQPVEHWQGFGQVFQQQKISGALLEDGQPTLFCKELGGRLAAESNPRLALEDDNFRRLYDACIALGDKALYSASRAFIVTHPILRDPFAELFADPTWEPILPELKSCYEPLPRSSNHSGQVYCCPYCGWALEWRRDRANCHPGGECAERAGDLSQSTKTLEYDPNTVRAKAGVQRYVVAPELALMQLYRRLSQKRELLCTLYPSFDAYDLRIVFPNGRIFAVDLKDHQNAARLATDLNQRPFRRDPKWDRAFYLFPKDRGDMAYLNTFDSFWTRQKAVSFMNTTRFIRLVNRELKR